MPRHRGKGEARPYSYLQGAVAARIGRSRSILVSLPTRLEAARDEPRSAAQLEDGPRIGIDGKTRCRQLRYRVRKWRKIRCFRSAFGVQN